MTYYDPRYRNQQYAGYARQQQRPRPKMTQGLTNEEIAKLENRNVQFTLRPEPIELLRAKCTHRKDGHTTLVPTKNGEFKCNLCGATFKPIQTYEQAANIVKSMDWLMQTIKMYYVDIPEDFLNQFATFIAAVPKMAQLFNISLKNTYKYFNPEQLHEYRGASSFDTYDAIASGRSIYPNYNGPSYAPESNYPTPGFDYGYNPNYAGPVDPYSQQPPVQGAPYGGSESYGRNPLTEDGGTAVGYNPEPTSNNNNQNNGAANVTKQFDI